MRNPRPRQKTRPGAAALLPGPFLTVLSLPPFTAVRNITAVRAGLSATAVVAVCDMYPAVEISGTTAYIPLSYADKTGTFTATGAFFTAIAVTTDAFSQIVITLGEKVAVNYLEGSGVLDLAAVRRDILKPDPSDPDDPTNPDYEPRPGDNPDNTVTPGDTLNPDGGSDPLSGGRAVLTVLNLPPNTLPSSFSSVQISDSFGPIAKCKAYEGPDGITVTDSAASIPLADLQDRAFAKSGYFYVSFTVNVDISTTVTLRPSDKRICLFNGGNGAIDLDNLQSEYFDPSDPDATIQSTVVFINLPDDTSPLNISDVFIGNASASVAKSVEPENFSVLGNTALVPVTYISGASFTESGNFYVSFTITVDALTSVRRTLPDKCLYYFRNGGTVIDLSNLPPVTRHDLTLVSLPAYTIDPNVTEVTVYDLDGKLASVADLENVSVKNGAAVIPLVYDKDTKLQFYGSGAFYVSFAVTVDAITRISVTLDDRILVNFTDGNGTFDITHIPQKPDDPHNLVLYNLPRDTAAAGVTGVKVYNTGGEIAKCADYSAIAVLNSQAVIPLVNSADGLPFVQDGFFYIELTVDAGALDRYVLKRANNILCEFYGGNGSFDIQSVTQPGHFSGGLLNESDSKAPVLKAGSAFEINGGYVKLQDNVSFTQLGREESAVRVVYLYAYETEQNLAQNYYGVRALGTYRNIEFVYSSEDPAFNAAKNAWYRGQARALFKFLYVRETSASADRYLFKTYAKDDFPAFKVVVPSPGGGLLNSYKGEDDRPPQSLNLQSGIYCFELQGAGGGGGGGAYGEETLTYTGHAAASYTYTSSGSAWINWSSYTDTYNYNYRGGGGGAGGRIIEVVNFKSARILEAFTGSGGKGAYKCRNIQGYEFGGGGGGGGGSGSYILTEEYLLCAGGGGGGSGGFFHGAGGGGGAGGSIGPGGGGGGGAHGGGRGGRGGNGGGSGAGEGGYSAQKNADYNVDWISTGESGTDTAFGNGNLLGFGAGGDFAYYCSPNNTTLRIIHTYGKSGAGGNAAYFSNAAQLWKNTNNANGQGARVNTYNYFEYSYYPSVNTLLPTGIQINQRETRSYHELDRGSGNAGGTGGNNRNAARGDGAKGGAGSVRSTSVSQWDYTAPASDGAPGYINVYRIK